MMLLNIILVIIIVEGILQLLIRIMRTRFPWLITPKDIAPVIPLDLIKKHAKQSFHPELGWLQQPGARWSNPTSDGDVTYEIDDQGRRKNPGFDDAPMPIAVYGDSFAFCRLVPDEYTWPHFMSEELKCHVGNYGVGNYGLDQALLRYESDPPKGVRVVIMAVVPETIVRIQSFWKHYFEYGNVLAFKPRFIMNGGNITLIPSPIQTPDDYSNYTTHLEYIQNKDGFYYRKFLRDIIGFPALIHLMRNPKRHLSILSILTFGAIRRDFTRAKSNAFEVILQENAKWMKKLYVETESCDLLRNLIRRFKISCENNNSIPMLIIIPQPTDIQKLDREIYEDFYNDISKEIQVVDFTHSFKELKGSVSLYVQGPLGPHTSKEANEHIAKELIKKLRDLHIIKLTEEVLVP